MKNRTARRISAFLSNFIIIVLGVGMLYPVVWLIAASFKESNTIFSDPGLIPKSFTLQNYIQGWKGIGIIGFGTFFKNSFIICTLCVIANVIFCSLTAYAFARLRFAGKNFWFAVMMVTLMLPSHVTTIPRYIIFRSFGWIDTFLPLVVPKFFATDAFFIFLLVQFMRSLPKELDESAMIDGCGKFGIYTRIVMPLMDMGRFLQSAFISELSIKIYGSYGIKALCGFFRHVVMGSNVRYVCPFAGSLFYSLFLVAEIFCTGNHHYGYQGIVVSLISRGGSE